MNKNRIDHNSNDFISISDINTTDRYRILLRFSWYGFINKFNLNKKSKVIITSTISYQFQTLIPRIDPEFYCGSRGMVYIKF